MIWIICSIGAYSEKLYYAYYTIPAKVYHINEDTISRVVSFPGELLIQKNDSERAAH